MTDPQYAFTGSLEAPSRNVDTSRQAGRQVTRRLKQAHQDALAALAVADLTADEVAALLGWDVLFARPRMTELGKMGLIRDSGVRRPSSRKNPSVVWRLANGSR